MEKCAGCRFYDRSDAQSDDKSTRWGKCRRTGPMVHPVSVKPYMVEGIWPYVRDDDWCGEWEPSKRRVDAQAAEAMNSLMMQGAAAAPRPAMSPTSSLLAVPAASLNELPPGTLPGRFSSD